VIEDYASFEQHFATHLVMESIKLQVLRIR